MKTCDALSDQFSAFRSDASGAQNSDQISAVLRKTPTKWTLICSFERFSKGT